MYVSLRESHKKPVFYYFTYFYYVCSSGMFIISNIIFIFVLVLDFKKLIKCFGKYSDYSVIMTIFADKFKNTCETI